MFKIFDGRTDFFQWDKEQKVIIEDRSITEVHFCNRTDDCSLVCTAYELDGLWVADVPNVLLQDNWKIRVYAYCVNHTKIEESFKVKARSKPSDYVYTETEIKNYDDLAARVEALENGGSAEYATTDYVDEAINNALDAIGVAEQGAY